MHIVAGPSIAIMMRAMEWGNHDQRPLLVFQHNDGYVESVHYRVQLADLSPNALFVIALTTSEGADLEVIWEPHRQKGRVIQPAMM